jgi:hypothetical protein
LRNGSMLEESQSYPRGGSESPLPPEELAEKFRANGRMALSGDRVEEIFTAVAKLPELPAISGLADLLSPP